MIALVLAAAVATQPAAGRRQAVTELAYALGEMHALSQTCLGEGDQAWRERMNRLIGLEVTPGDDAGRRALIERFNAGFALGKAEHPACTPEAEARRQQSARRGLVLSRRLQGE